MANQIACPTCGNNIAYSESSMGQSTQCPICGDPIRFPIRVDIERPVEVTVKPTATTDHVRASFLSGFGGAFGVMAAIAVAFMLIVAVFIGGYFILVRMDSHVSKQKTSIVATSTPSHSTESPPEKIKPPLPVRVNYSPHNNSCTINGIRVEVVGVGVFPMIMWDRISGKLVQNQNPSLNFRIVVSTANTNQKYDHTSWGEPGLFEQRVVVKDEHGNRYRQYRIPTYYEHLDGLGKAAVQFGQPFNDFIMVELPVPAATYIDLDLVGLDGEVFRFRIERSLFWKNTLK